jgi:hypothetical protein
MEATSTCVVWDIAAVANDAVGAGGDSAAYALFAFCHAQADPLLQTFPVLVVG